MTQKLVALSSGVQIGCAISSTNLSRGTSMLHRMNHIIRICCCTKPEKKLWLKGLITKADKPLATDWYYKQFLCYSTGRHIYLCQSGRQKVGRPLCFLVGRPLCFLSITSVAFTPQLSYDNLPYKTPKGHNDLDFESHFQLITWVSFRMILMIISISFL